MKKSKTVSVLCAVLLCMAVTSCGKTDAAGPADTAENNAVTEENDMNTENEFPASAENVKMLGRTYFDGGKLYCALSGTGAEFTMTGEKCTVVIEGAPNCTNPSNADNIARVGIYVNGERVVDDMVDNVTETYEISGKGGETTVSVVKLSEAPHSVIAIEKIIADGGIKPTANKDMLIEFVGDSITCGYGVDDPDRDHHFSTKTEDITKAYAYKTAQALGADYSMVSFSGYGIITGYSDGKTKSPSQRVPLYYTKLGHCWGSDGSFVPQNVDWDFSRLPDVVVINLGTNDSSYTIGKEDRCEEYAEDYAKFLKTVREKNPDAKILCTLGIMGAELYPYVEKAVESYKTETGDEKIYTMQFDTQIPDDGFSADWHPSITTHDKASAKLAEKIKEILAE